MPAAAAAAHVAPLRSASPCPPARHCVRCAQVRQLGSGDVGMVDLVHLVGTDQRFALKSLEKREMLERNKVRGRQGMAGWHVWLSWFGGLVWGVVLEHAGMEHAASSCCCRAKLGGQAGRGTRPAAEDEDATPLPCCPGPSLLQVGRVRTEEAILSCVDHPFLASLYGTLQTGALPVVGRTLHARVAAAAWAPRCPMPSWLAESGSCLQRLRALPAGLRSPSSAGWARRAACLPSPARSRPLLEHCLALAAPLI